MIMPWLRPNANGNTSAVNTVLDTVSESLDFTMTAKSNIDNGVRSGGLADPVLLEKIDKLFACNLGDYIDLPQLVVVVGG